MGGKNTWLSHPPPPLLLPEHSQWRKDILAAVAVLNSINKAVLCFLFAMKMSYSR